jgi:hypothetical protein
LICPNESGLQASSSDLALREKKVLYEALSLEEIEFYTNIEAYKTKHCEKINSIHDLCCAFVNIDDIL